MFDKDESSSKQQQERLNQQLSSLFDDSDDSEEFFDEGFEESETPSKKPSKHHLRKPRGRYRNSLEASEDDDEGDEDIFGSTSRQISRQKPRQTSRQNRQSSRQTPGKRPGRYSEDYFEDDSDANSDYDSNSDLDDIFGPSSEQSPKRAKRQSRSKSEKKKPSRKTSEKKSRKHKKEKSEKSQNPLSSIFKRKSKDKYFEDDENALDVSRVSDLYNDDSGEEFGDIGYPEDYEIFDPSENARERQKSRKARKQKRQPGPDNHVYYDRDGNIIEDDDKIDKPAWTKPRIAKWVTIAVIISLVSLTAWGGYNTDFDKNGKAYVVPLELLPERAYIRKADKLLNVILSMDKTFDEDTYYLPTDYSNMYSKLTKVKKTLNESTNDLSRYVNVPEDYQGYHSDLINFSLSIQDCIDNLIKNREATDYEDYREEVFAEYLQDLNSIKKQRKEIETELFINVTSDDE